MRRGAAPVLLALLMLLAACGHSQPKATDLDCPVTLPDAQALEQWRAQLEKAKPQLAKVDNWSWPDKYEGADSELRRLATFEHFYPLPSDSDTDLVFPTGVLTGIVLSESVNAGDPSSKFNQIQFCTGLVYQKTVTHPATPPFSMLERDYHYFHGPGLTRIQLAWIADWLVQKYLDTFIFGSPWNLYHGEGLGGSI